MRERYSEMAAKQVSENGKPQMVFGHARKPTKMHSIQPSKLFPLSTVQERRQDRRQRLSYFKTPT